MQTNGGEQTANAKVLTEGWDWRACRRESGAWHLWREASHVKVVGDGSGTRRKVPEKDSELVIKAGSPAAVS